MIPMRSYSCSCRPTSGNSCLFPWGTSQKHNHEDFTETEDVKQHQTQCWPLGVHWQWLDSNKPHATDHHSLGPAIQPVFNITHCLPTQPIIHHLLSLWGLMGSTAKNLAEVKVDNIHSSLIIPQASHFTIEAFQVGQALLPFFKAMLAAPNCLLVLHVPGKRLQD